MTGAQVFEETRGVGEKVYFKSIPLEARLTSAYGNYIKEYDDPSSEKYIAVEQDIIAQVRKRVLDFSMKKPIVNVERKNRERFGDFCTKF